MIEIRCQDCGSELLIQDEPFRTGLLDGTIVTGSYVIQQRVGSGEYDTRDIYNKAFLYVCKGCQVKPNVALSENTKVASIAQESAEIQRLMDGVRETHPEWSLEDAAHEAQERFNDVSRVRNQGFRAYLMERVTVNP